jgi:predicted RNase H-like nuclease (RuvC/YqgF family)
LKEDATMLKAQFDEKDKTIKELQAKIDNLAREAKTENEKNKLIIQEISKNQEKRFFDFRIMPGEE